MLVGEAWGHDEDRLGEPFVGASGQELNRMLHEAGIMRSECFVTNLVNYRPPANDLGQWIAFKKKDITSVHRSLRDKMVLPIVEEGYKQLMNEIQNCKPNVIVAFGNAAMWALTGQWGILKWRGSLLAGGAVPKVIPTIHPAAVLREWTMRGSVLNDLQRAKKHITSRVYDTPAYRFLVKPSLSLVLDTLNMLQHKADWFCRNWHTGAEEYLWLDLDLETNTGHIACCGLSWSRLDALCIPFMHQGSRSGYWSEEEEAEIIYRLYKLLTHPAVRVRWQNGLYDAQYILKHWHFIPRGAQDTMISQHAIFSDLPKALHYQASMYAEHYVYWKDEGKQLAKGGSDEQHWIYNCLDCVYTREVGEVEEQVAAKLGLQEVHKFQQQLFWPVLRAMTRGIRIINENANKLAEEIQEQISIREAFMQDAIGRVINIDSPKQMMELFYTELAQPVIMTRAKKGVPAHPTCDDEALQKIGNREPLLRPLVNSIADLRTLGKFLGDFVLAKRSSDGRMRCSFNIGGSESGKSAPKTYRLSSSKDAFGSGANLQTIPSEKSKSVGKWDQRQHFTMIGDPYALPNLRSMYGPDPDFTFFDRDLDRADLHVFVWEIDDELYKEVLRKKIDAHLLHVYLLDNKEPPPLDELIETHPKYWDHRGPRKLKREFSKVFCHAVDYVGGDATISAATGRTRHEVSKAKKTYLAAHPKIEPYWKEVEVQLQKRRYVENRFGYRWYVFDRIEGILPEAVAWIPQSTVSIVINKIWNNLYLNAKEIEVLLQVHDSLAGQFPTHRKEHCLRLIEANASISIPYPDPLIIPGSIGTSEENWGKC